MILILGPSHFQPRRGRASQVLQHLRSRHRVIDGRTADKDHHQQPQDIDADVALASHDVLAAIIATLTALFGRLHRLTLETGGTRSRLLRGRLLRADFRAQRIHEVLPRAITAPLRTLLVDGTFGEQIVRQQVPLAARAVEILDRVDDFTHVHFSRSPARLSQWDERL